MAPALVVAAMRPALRGRHVGVADAWRRRDLSSTRWSCSGSAHTRWPSSCCHFWPWVALQAAVASAWCAGLSAGSHTAARSPGTPPDPPTRRLGTSTGRGKAARSAVHRCRTPEYLKQAIGRTELERPLVLVVGFSAAWCGPCKLMEPKLKEMSERFDGKAIFIKVLQEDFPEGNISSMLREKVYVLPFYQIYKGGQQVDTVKGASPVALLRRIQEHTAVDGGLRTGLDEWRRGRDAEWDGVA